MEASNSHAGLYFKIMLFSYLGTMVWQVVWFGLLPPPWGVHNVWLALAAFSLLLIPLKGLLQGRYRSMVWAGFLLLLYFMIGVMEAWSNPPQRIPALVELALPLLYLLAFRQHHQK